MPQDNKDCTLQLLKPETRESLHTAMKTHHSQKQKIILKNFVIHKKEWNIAICNNVDRPRDYHNWVKSDRERQMLYDITPMWNLKNNAD